MASRGHRRPPERGPLAVLGLLAPVFALVAVGLIWLSLSSPFAADGDAGERSAATNGLRVETSRAGDRARVHLEGRVRSGGTGPVTVRILGRDDVAGPCPTPIVRPSGAVEVPSGGVRVGWRTLSGRAPGTSLARGAAFRSTGTVATRGGGALRLCVHLVRGGSRPAVLRTVRVVVPSRRGITPVSVAVRPVLDTVVIPVLRGAVVLGLVAALILGGVVVRRMVRWSRPVRGPVQRHRGPEPSWAVALDLPPLPDDVRVPDVLPWDVGEGPGNDGVGEGSAAGGGRGLAGGDDTVDPGAGFRAVPTATEQATRPEPTTAAPSHVRAWSIGAEGERLAAARFDELLRGYPRVQVLHDRRAPFRRRASIDHVLVGPAGVVVADTKHWAGAVRVVDDRLKVRGFDRTAAVDDVRGQVSAVRAVLTAAGLGAVPVVGVLHWTRTEDVALDGSIELRDVALLDARGTMMRAIDGEVLGRDGVRQVLRVLESGLPVA